MNRQQIRSEVEKRCSAYTTQEIFSNASFAQMLSATAESMCAKENRMPNITIEYSPEISVTACTNGLDIHINTASPLIREMANNWQKYLGCIGHIAHEAGHILYTDFTELNPLRSAWCEGPFHFYPQSFDMQGAHEIEVYLSSHENMHQLYAKAMSDLVNIMEDVYIERRIYQNFAGFVSAGITKVNDEGDRLTPTFNSRADVLLQGRILPIHLFNSLVHTIYNGYSIKYDQPLNEMQSKVKQVMDYFMGLCKEELEELATESDGKKRVELFNILFVKLFPLIPEIQDPSKEASPAQSVVSIPIDSSGALSGKHPFHMDYDDKQSQSLQENAEKLLEQCFITDVPQGQSAPVESENINHDEVERNRKNAQKLAENEAVLVREYRQMVHDLANIEVLKEDEKEHEASLKKEAEMIHNEHRGKTCGISGFVLKRPQPDPVEYKMIHKDVQESARTLFRKLKCILSIRETEDYETGCRMGNRFNAKAAVHKEEGRLFKKKNQPTGNSKVVFSILVDESGSMSGRCYRVSKLAILLEEVLRLLDIPLMIVGHTTEGNTNKVVLRCYVDFNSNDLKDRYRLPWIGAYDCNIDGAAIAYCTSRLLKRSEDIKVLIVISDGKPCGGSYFSNDADEDTRLAVNTARKKGVRVLAASLNSYKEICNLYGSQYVFDCSDYDTMQKQLIMLIKRYIRQTLI